ncbi:MAG: 8-oxo-dGTP diphosphatase MutT, partial [Thiogranum sp.]
MHGEYTAVIDVAAGIVTRTDGRVLMAERPAGKPWAGYWEFPGGKFESGETPVVALARELHEELGIELDQAYPWITRVYDYPERRVRLHMYRVFKWHGKPHGKEGQQISWENPQAVQCEQLLPANDPILR